MTLAGVLNCLLFFSSQHCSLSSKFRLFLQASKILLLLFRQPVFRFQTEFYKSKLRLISYRKPSRGSWGKFPAQQVIRLVEINALIVYSSRWRVYKLLVCWLKILEMKIRKFSKHHVASSLVWRSIAILSLIKIQELQIVVPNRIRFHMPLRVVWINVTDFIKTVGRINKKKLLFANKIIVHCASRHLISFSYLTHRQLIHLVERKHKLWCEELICNRMW